MSLIKKIFFTLLVAVVFSLPSASSVSAQELLNNSALSTTTINMSDFQSQPDVSIGNLVLDKTVYEAGGVVKGSFVFLNNKKEPVSDVYYRVTLAGDYQKNTLANIFYDTVKHGPYYLLGGESRKIDFTYTLPMSIAGDNLGIQIGASLSTGFNMGWKDFRIKIEGEMNFLDTPQAFISIGSDKFPLQAGPMVYETEKAFFEVELKNPTKNIIEVDPHVVVYDRASEDKVFKELKTGALEILPGTISKIKYELPKFENKAGVYVGNVKFLDTAGVKRAMDLEFRYIVQGDIATIRGLTVDKTDVKKGDDVKVRVSYSGSPFDIRDSSKSTNALYDLDIKLFSAEDKLIVEYNNSLDFNKGNETVVTLKTIDKGTILKSEVIIKKENIILAEYKSELPKIENKGESKMDYLKMFGLLVVIMVLLILVISSSMKRRNKVIISLFLIILAGVLSPLYFVKSYWTETLRTSTFKGDYPKQLSVHVNSPVGGHNPGQSYFLTGWASAINCENQDQVQDYWYKREGGTGGTYGGTSGILENSFDSRTGQFSIGPFIAESTPGNHIIWLEVDFYPYHAGKKKTAEGSSLVGYKTYTVTAPVAPTLTATTSPNCGGKVNLSWNAIPGATSYNLYRDGVLVSTANVTLYIDTAPAPSTQYSYIVKMNYSGGSSDLSSAVSAISSAACAPLSASCEASPNPAVLESSSVTVNWTAIPSGGDGSYTYSWIGTDGLSGSSSTVSKSYTSTGTKYATTTIVGGSETMVIGCPGTVTSGGGGVRVVNPSPVDGVCGQVNGGVFINGTDLGNSTTRCAYYPFSTSSPSTFSPGGPWTWTCSGIYGSATSSLTCTASQTQISNPAYNCTLAADLSSPVNVNTNVVWTASTIPPCSSCVTKWKVIDSNNPNPDFIVGTNPWNKIFTTIGSKTVSVQFASSTALNIVGMPCIATTTVVQEGGSSSEI